MTSEISSETAPIRARWDRRWAPWLIGAGLAAVLLPELGLAQRNWQALAVTVIVAAVVGWLAPIGRLALLGVVMVAVAGWLFRQISFPWTVWLIAAVAGGGIGLAVPTVRDRLKPWTVLAAVITGAILLLVRRLAGADAAVTLAVIAVAGMASLAVARSRPASPGRMAVAAVVAILATALSTAWVGASTAHVTWFGSLVVHGSRDTNMVALTFDDGPNIYYTLQVAHILDENGIKGSFFIVGKAMAKRPDIVRQLMADGMLLGNHSYTHNSTAWLNPRYPEFRETEDLFKRDLGVCPAFYRPPHGQHTPFITYQVREVGGTVVTWDVSAGDWATTDGQLVAQRVLSQVKPGSIIDLHDGLDGDLTANRSVLLTALPIIIEGLKQRGLQPVTLDKLLGKPGYVPHC